MKAKVKSKRTSDAVAILDRMAEDSSEMRRLMEEARPNAAVAQLIYAARTKAGLSRAQLAERIGTVCKPICSLGRCYSDAHSF